MDTKEALMWAEKARMGTLEPEDYAHSFEVACTLASFIVASLGEAYDASLNAPSKPV